MHHTGSPQGRRTTSRPAFARTSDAPAVLTADLNTRNDNSGLCIKATCQRFRIRVDAGDTPPSTIVGIASCGWLEQRGRATQHLRTDGTLVRPFHLSPASAVAHGNLSEPTDCPHTEIQAGGLHRQAAVAESLVESGCENSRGIAGRGSKRSPIQPAGPGVI